MNTPGPLALAIDVGTSSCRAVVYDARGLQVPGTGARMAYTPTLTHDGGAELDADSLLDLVASAVDGALAQAGEQRGGIAVVGVSTFWHSLLGVDAAGRALTPVYLWMDARSRAQAARLRAELDERAIHARTGCVLHWTYWPAKLLWLRETNPELFARVRRWVSFGEYLALRLSGDEKVSASMASGTGLLDQHTLRWDDALLDALGLDANRLCAVARDSGRSSAFASAGLRSPYAERWPLLNAVPWLRAVGDGACSNVGCGCTTRKRAALMVGTSGAMRVLWRAEELAIPWGVWGYRLDEAHALLGGALNDGGSLFAWLRGTLELPAPDEAEAALAAMEPDVHGLTVVPAWAGERSPGWADDARGAIVGLRLSTTPVEILRAALEGIALRFRAIDAILRQAVPEGAEVVATGGALLRSPAWLQIMADVLGRPVEASAEPEASSRGAALLALDAAIGLDGGIDGLIPAVARVYEPVLAHAERYAAAAERQQRIYELLTP